jgi:hypothetical protein
VRRSVWWVPETEFELMLPMTATLQAWRPQLVFQKKKASISLVYDGEEMAGLYI